MATKKPANKPAGRQSLADLWDDTDPSEASTTLPAGTHEVRINSMIWKDDKKKGEAVFLEVEGIEGDIEGLKARQLYKLRDADGGKGPGIAYLMRDLALIGYKDVKFAKLKKVLKEVTDEQPMVVVNAKENGQWTNVYIQGLVGEVKDADGEGDNEGGDVALEEGDIVTWEDGDKTGRIESINTKKETAKVQPIDSDGDDDGDVENLDLDDLTKKEGDGAGDYVPEEDDVVTFNNSDGDETTGKIISVNAKKETAKIQPLDDDGDDDGDEVKVDFSDIIGKKEESSEGEKEAYVPEEDDIVTWEDGDKTGKVVSVDEKKEVAKVQPIDSDGDDDGKVEKVAFDDLTKKEEEEEKPKKGKGKGKKFVPKVGDDVKWTDSDGDEQTGEITKIKGDSAKVKDADDDVHDVDLSDLEAND